MPRITIDEHGWTSITVHSRWPIRWTWDGLGMSWPT